MKKLSLLFSLLLVLAGVFLFVYLVKTRPEPHGEIPAVKGRLVRAFEARKVDHRVTVKAHGTAKAGKEWEAVVEVPGKAIRVNRQFEPGEVLWAGTELLAIDPTDYEIAVERSKAQVRSNEQKIEEIEQTRENLRQILDLLERQLSLSESELARRRSLFEKGTVTKAELESAENRFVSQKIKVRQTENELDLIPVRLDLQRAALDLARAQLEQATTNLAKTRLILPFDARCASKNVEVEQFVPAGRSVGRFFSVDRAEVEAILEGRQVRMLALDQMGATEGFRFTDDGEIVPFWERITIPAQVHVTLGGETFGWRGKVSRFGSSLDPRTRTINVTVDVPRPFKDAVPGVRPPLLPGMFCEVRIYGATLEQVSLVPRTCLHDGKVHVVRNGILEIRSVEVAAIEDDTAVIRSGLEEGDQVVLTDLYPASEGMPLRVQLVENPALNLFADPDGL